MTSNSTAVFSHGMSSGIEFAQITPSNASDSTASSAPLPALCLHGIGGDYSSFQPQLEKLGHERHTLAWNMPGYGRSAALESVDFKSLAQSVIQLLDALAIEKVDLVGHSIGGMLAIEAALRYPDRVRSLVLIATTSAFGGRDDSFKQEFLKARLAPLDAGESMARLAERFVPEITGTVIEAHHQKLAVASMAAVPEATYREILKCLVTFNRREDVKSLSQPCCLIAGSVDRSAPAKTMDKLSGNLPDAEFHCIEGAGHLTNLEAPDAVNGIIDEFLNRQG